MTTSAEPARPGWAFVLASPAHFVAFSAGVGLMPVAPGTFGTVLGFPLHAVLAAVMPRAGVVTALALLFALGIWAAGRAGRALGVEDHGGIVWDETVAFALVLCFTPPGLAWGLAAFGAFRLFDIWKPWPVSLADRRVGGGFGVMLDDLLAAVYAVAAVALAAALLP